MDPRKPGKNKGNNVHYIQDAVRRWTFRACGAIQKIWVVRARDGSLRLSFPRPATAKAFAPESLEGLDVELLAVGPRDEEHVVRATLTGVSAVSVRVPGLPLLDEVRIQGALVLANPADAARLWFEANEGDASNVARITFDREEERLAWANERFPAVVVAPPPPSRRCM